MIRREVPLDAGRVLRALDEHGVAYALIGGLAVQAYGHTRTTQDVDIVPDPDPENLHRLAEALRELDARPAGRRSREAGWDGSFASDGATSLDTVAGGVDVHMRPPGAAPFAELRKRALVIEVLGAVVPVASRDDLIAMKRAPGRPIDRGDVIALAAGERE